MTFLATDDREARQAAQLQALGSMTERVGSPAPLEGAGTATALGVGRGAVSIWGLAEEINDWSVPGLIQRGVDAAFELGIEERQERAIAAAMEATRLDPETTGYVGNLTYGVGSALVPGAVGTLLGGPLAGAALAGGSVGTGTYYDLTAEGVDPDTALGAAGIEGGITALGFGLPAGLGFRTLTRAATGTGLNVGAGMGERAAMAAYLDERGYAEMAERYQWLDGVAIATDAVLGAAFGALPVSRGTRAKPQQAEIDAALAGQAVKQAELDLAPGLPANAKSAAANIRAQDLATQQLLNGERVQVDEVMAGTRFVPKPANPALADAVVVQALRESGFPEIEAEIGRLESELAARGRVVDEAPLPDLGAAMDRIEQGGGRFGRATDVKIGDEYAAARWAVLEAEEVAPTLQVAENQLRDRTRAASELQVNEIAAKLDPRLLLVDAPTMDVGAPTLTADGKVVAGNGRAIAIRRAYSGERGRAYREALAEAAPRFGVDPEAVAGMRQPVLVRVLQQAVDVERAAILSNEGGAMRMSGLEQARVDAGRLPSLAGVELPESGDFTAAALRDYVRGWVQQFPAGQRAALLDAEGRLSQEGITRLRNAVLFRAYGDSAVLQRLVESADPGARNVAQALVRAAPKVAEVKDAIARGELHPLDISESIVRAADLVEQIRDQGLTVDNWIAQLDLFNPGETPATLALLRFIDANKRSARAISDVLGGYYDAVIAAGNPGQGNMLGGAAPDATTLLSNAIAKAAPAKAAEIVQDTLFRPAKAAEEVRPEAVIRAAEMQADGWGMPAPARTLPDGDPLLQPRHADMSPERVAMREALIEERFAGKAPAQGRPVALVLGGGGASGKGTILKRLRGAGRVPEGAVELDPDGFKVKLPEYAKIRDAGDSRAAAVTHDESSLIFKGAVDRAVAGKYNVVLDRTLGDPVKGLAELQRLKDAGYEIRLVGVTVDPVSAIKRAAERAKGKDKRHVPVDVLLKAHKGFAQAFEQYAALADAAMLFDNEVPKGADPRPIAAGSAGKPLTVLDEKAYAEFARKGGLNEKAADESGLYGPVHRGGESGPGGRELLGGGDARDAGAGRRGVRGRGAGEVRQPQGADAVPGLRRELDPQPILADRPDLTITTDDGAPAYAADTLAAADVAEQRAQTDALGFEAAVNCFLRSAA